MSEETVERTEEQLASDYTAMGHSISLITDVIAGDSMADEDAEDRQDCVDRNVQHLELWLLKMIGAMKIWPLLTQQLAQVTDTRILKEENHGSNLEHHKLRIHQRL